MEQNFRAYDVSECDTSVFGVFRSDERGVLLEIDRIRWIGGTTVDVVAYDLYSGVGASFWLFTLERGDSSWEITGRELLGAA